MQDTTPGQVFAPMPTGEPQTPDDGAPKPDRPTEPDPAPNPSPPPEPAAPATFQTVPEADWQYAPQNTATTAITATTDLPERLEWTASEFISHDKTPGWYAVLAGVAVVVIGLVYLLTRDKITTGIILFAVVAFGIFAARKPRVQQYVLGNGGIQVGAKYYDLQAFKTFSIAEDGSIASIIFMPLKRFMPPLTIYITPEIGDQVIDLLSAYMPIEPHQADALDSLLRRIHF